MTTSSDYYAVTKILTSDGFYDLLTTVFTDQPCHLWLFRSYKEPVRTITWRPFRGTMSRCQVSWSIGGARSREQYEPGDSLIHTFYRSLTEPHHDWWDTCAGTINGYPARSVGPIWTYHHTPVGYNVVKALPTGAGATCNITYGVKPCPDHWEVVNKYECRYDGNEIWDERTGGSFPAWYQGDLYDFGDFLAHFNYELIHSISLQYRVRKFKGWQGQGCNIPQASAVSQIRTLQYYQFGEAKMIPDPWGLYNQFYDDYTICEHDHAHWYWRNTQNLQAGIQLQRPCFMGIQLYTACCSFVMSVMAFPSRELTGFQPL